MLHLETLYTCCQQAPRCSAPGRTGESATVNPGDTDPQMLTETEMKAAMQQYIEGFNQSNAEGIISLFAERAKIEDPVGGGKIVEGKAAITSFYQRAVALVDKLEPSAPITGSYSNSAAMAFTILMNIDGQPVRIQVIDVMTFDSSGKIVDMKAFHGPGDVSTR